MKFEISKAALDDLELIGDEIALNSPSVARRFVADLRTKARQITQFPYAYQQLEDQGDEAMRRRVVGNYLIVYYVEASRIVIVRIVHGSRNIGELLSSGRS